MCATAATSRAKSAHLRLSLQFAAPAHAAHRAVLKRPMVLRWIRSVLATDAELTVRWVDADEARMLNRTYRGKDYATNVLTFAYDEDDHDLPDSPTSTTAEQAAPLRGDLVLCCPVVESEATEQGKSLEAHYAHLIVHGTLHAQGYDHEAEAEAEQIEALESAALQAMGYADPYA